jgi:ATP-binding cassette subfamily B protein
LGGDRVLGRGLRVLGHSIREQPRLFIIGVGGSVLFSLLIIAGAYIVGAVVGRVVVPSLDHGHVRAAALAAGAGVIFAVSAGKVVGLFGRRLGAGAMQFALQATYRRQVTRRYLALPLAWHHRHATGTLLSNANADVEAAFYPIAPLPFAVGTIVMLVTAVASLFFTDWVIALVGVGIFLALLVMNIVYSRRISPRVSAAQRLRAEVSAVAHESFDGALVVKTMGRESEETQRFAVKAGELREALIQVGRVRGLFDPALDALPSFGTLAVLLVGAWRLRQGAITVADIVSVMFLFTVLAFPVRAIGWVLAELPRSAVGWERVQNVLTATGDMVYGRGSLPAGAGPASLSFSHVDFGYADGQPVLHDVTFEVPAGRTVALVGPTGSGKSTIASLAARLVDPTGGSVRLDGADVSTLTQQSLAVAVALVPQVPFVFDDTIRGNITLDRDGIDDAAAWRAVRTAQAEAFVSALPQGLDTTVGERGTSLSGGQRQRLTIARALAGGPRLLVLDDATSAVDPRVEAAILSSLRAGSSPRDGEAGASILVVAYRRATITLADEVVYVEHGRVVAHGTHAHLLDTVPGYANLVTAYEKADAEREREKAYDESAADQEVPA